MRHRVLAVLLSAVFVGGAISACAAIQEDLVCPGADCPESLGEVSDWAADETGVESVVRSWRFANLDKGEFGGLRVRASVTERDEAFALATRLARIYVESDVEPTEEVSIQVVPVPETGRPDSQTLRMAAAGEGASCASAQCADELARLESELAERLDGSAADVEDLIWSSGTGVVVALSSGPAPLTQLDVNDILARSAAAASEIGATGWGRFNVELSFHRLAEFEFAFDGVSGAPVS